MSKEQAPLCPLCGKVCEDDQPRRLALYTKYGGTIPESFVPFPEWWCNHCTMHHSKACDLHALDAPLFKAPESPKKRRAKK